MSGVLKRYVFCWLLCCGVFSPSWGSVVVDGCGMDFGNNSSVSSSGWTNIGVRAVDAGSTDTFVNVPLIRNGGLASSAPVKAGCLLGQAVYLSVSAKSSASNFKNLLVTNTLWVWQEGGFSRGTHTGATPESPSVFNFPNYCEAFNTSLRLAANGIKNASATVRLSFSGLLPGKEYTVSFFLGSNEPAYQSIVLVRGDSGAVVPLQTSAGVLSGSVWNGAKNTSSQDVYMAVAWRARASAEGVLEFDVVKNAHVNASGRLELSAVTMTADEVPVIDPKPVSAIHNKALLTLPSSVVLPVSATAWRHNGVLTCELWVKPEGASSSGDILSLGGVLLSLKEGILQLKAGGLVLEAPKTVFGAGVWHHIAAVFGETNASLYVDGVLEQSMPKEGFLKEMIEGWNGLVLESSFSGARDELRLWNAELGQKEGDFFMRGPLPMAHPQYAHLLGVWRLDGDFRDAKWTEFAHKTGSLFVQSWQALVPKGTGFGIVSDNDVFRYMLTTAYVREAHIMWQWPERAHLLNNSDLIYFGSASPAANGDVNFSYPDNDVQESKGVSLLPAEGGRTNILAFSGAGAYMNVGEGLMTGAKANNFTIEVNMALSSQWQNVALFENDSVTMNLLWSNDHYVVRVQVGAASVWAADLPALPQNEYFWLAFIKNSATGTGVIYLNGTALTTTTSTSGLPLGSANAVIGKNLAGKIDEMRVWHLARLSSSLGAPIQPNWNDRLIVARWGESDIFGRDTASWVAHVRILRQMTKDTGGTRIRLGVSGGEWKELLSNANARQRFADNVAQLISQYDLAGVDLDFEWLTNNDATGWLNYGKLAQGIRTACPDTVFTISLHTVAYKFPVDYMQYVDYFTFQTYGPSIAVNTYDSMVSSCKNFRNQGYPDAKIMLSAPFQGTPGTSEGNYIKLYRDIAINCLEPHNPDLDSAVYSYSDTTKTLWYNGVTTIKKKVKYISDNKLAGFMYWDLGGDVADAAGKINYFDPRSLLRAANSAVSSTSFPMTSSLFSLSRVGAHVSKNGGAVTVKVQTDTPDLAWFVTSCPDMVLVSSSSGTGSTVLTLTVGGNTSGEKRSGLVTFRSADNQECSLLIEQTAAIGPTGYVKWTQDNFPEGTPEEQMSLSACPARDGISNLMKYATGLSPLKACGSVTRLNIVSATGAGRRLELSFPVNSAATDVRYIVECSRDCKTWMMLQEVDVTGKTEVKFLDTEIIEESGARSRFLRLKVTQ